MTQTPLRTASSKQHGQPEMTFMDHVHELKRRLTFVAATLLAATLLGYTIHDQIAHIILAPLNGEKLVYLTPGGGFDFIFKISFYFGILLTVPVLVYSIYKYLAPLMQQKTNRRYVAVIVITSFLLAICGVLFGYFVAVPSAINFLTTFAEDYVAASLTAISYLNFVSLYLLGLAALFQLPLILLIINSIIGPLNTKKLFSSQRFIVVLVFILAAIITPTPDVYNQLIIAGPILGMYQVGVATVIAQNRRTAMLRRELTPLARKLIGQKHLDLPEELINTLVNDHKPYTVYAEQSKQVVQPQAKSRPDRREVPQQRLNASRVDGFAV